MPLTVDRTAGTPIIVTGTTSADTEIVPSHEKIYFRFIRWYNATTTGHLCNITDKEGKRILTMRAEKDNDTQLWPIFTAYYGLRCDDLDSGSLEIHIR